MMDGIKPRYSGLPSDVKKLETKIKLGHAPKEQFFNLIGLLRA